MSPGDERSTLDWAALARLNTTLVILMGTTHLPAIASELLVCGKGPEVPAAIVERAGTPGQRVVRATLSSIADAARAGVRPPAIVVVGEVAALDLAGVGAAADPAAA